MTAPTVRHKVLTVTTGETDALMRAIEVLHRGDRETAKSLFRGLHDELAQSDHFHRCVLAHYMADAQDDGWEELKWDRIALEEAERATPSEFEGRFPGVTRESFLPSLHLNLAASYERVSQLSQARVHALAAREAVSGIQDTSLGRMTHDAIDRICARLLDENV